MMNIIVKIKDTATLSRIEELYDCLNELKDPEPDIEGFPDVIDSIKRGAIDTKQLKDFTYKQLQDDLDRRDNERENEIQAAQDAEMAQENQE